MYTNNGEMMVKWRKVEDRLPRVGNVKPMGLSWIVTDGEKVWIETMHPTWWNQRTKGGDLVKVTHWMPVPKPPMQTP
jgi:hypothetical protein